MHGGGEAPLEIRPDLVIPARELRERFVRSPGPGGQNVNKVASCVQLRFDAARSPSLDDATRTRVLRLAGRRATARGVVVIEAHRYRTRERNRTDARERLAALLRRAAEAPRPRKPTRVPRAAVRVRLADKRHRAVRKRERRPPGDQE